ncbi:MAG TPA: tetratricopeptide repeat protein [Gemmatimonadaceae bacterium]|nr:tetratricopeptide repeat protein [Gemmatimonadaceae bacterium]
MLQQGMAHHREGRLAEAAECYRRVPPSHPEYENARYMLGVIAHQEGRVEEAITAYRRALEIQPEFVDGYSNLGNALQELGRFEEALVPYRAALTIDPSNAGVWYTAGCAERARQRYVASIECFRRALALAPTWHEAQHNLAHMLFNLGQVDEALALFRSAAEGQHPELPRSMVAVVIPGSPTSDNQAILEARTHFAERDLPTARSVARTPHPRLRVGYLSSFFHRHNWMKPVWGLINQHDREQIDVHIFSDAPESAVQYGYRRYAGDRYYDISAKSNDAAADVIREAGIDVLVDLNGYSAMRRLPLPAMKPAPVLIGWFNMFATTGMAAYDCLIGDIEVVPTDEERFYRERIVRIPSPGSYLTFEVGYPVPDVAQRPEGAITFGCLAPLYKITPEVIATWRRILTEVPESTLILKATALAGEDERRLVREWFPDGRVRLDGPSDHYDFLKTYDEIDIALDTFPYNGGTTTTEAIWQGVPVVTFWGDRWVARTSASILRAGGLGELVRRDVDDYVAYAILLSQQPAKRAELRLTMRDRLASSPVCDTPGFARHMEQIYFEI